MTLIGVGLAISITTARFAFAAPLQEPLRGPKNLCFKYSTFTLAAGESVTDFSGGFEGMMIDVKGPKGKYTISESEIFARPRERGNFVNAHSHATIYALKGRERQYAIYGRTRFSPNSDRLIVRLRGDALRGTAADADIYDRFDVVEPRSQDCEHTFTYSWGF
jgi:hypothetical protein